MIEIKVIMVMIPDQDDQADGHNDGDGEMMCFSTTCDNHVYGKSYQLKC